MKNLLKFMSIGLVLAMVVFGQINATSQVEAGSDVAENDLEFMTTHETNDATVEKFYKASSSNTSVAVFIRDKDLNKTVTGTTTWKTCAGRIAAFDGIGNAVATRTAGTYVVSAGDYTTSGSGEGARMTVVVDGNGAATIATNTTGLLNPGCGFINNEVLTIADAALGGGGAAALTVTVNGVAALPANANAGLNGDQTTIFALDDLVGSEEVESTADGTTNLAYTIIDKREDSNGIAGISDTAAELVSAPNQYLGAKTSLVLNSLSVKQAGASLQLDSLNENAGTFSLVTDVAAWQTNPMIASYSFNAQQTYSANAAGSKRVHITSTSDATGEWIEIVEVIDEGANDTNITYNAGASAGSDDGSIDSSVFRGLVNINTDASAGAADNGAVWVQDGDTLTASYYEAKNTTDNTTGALISSTTATIDATSPTISNVSPVDGTLTKDTTPSLSFTIEDAGSGFDKSVSNFGDHVEVSVNGCDIPVSALGVTSHSTSAITISYNAAVDWTGVAKKTVGGAADVANCQTTESGNATHVRASGGFNVTSTGSAVALASSTVHGTLFSWYIKATDDAGNTKELGDNVHNLAATTSSELDLRIDTKAPAATAVAGAKAWSVSEKKDVTDNSSVKITFDESLDANSVTAADFTVSGVGVTSSTIETVSMGGDGALTDSLVYLDLAADLGPNAKPKVKLVGQVTDRAGNVLKPSTTETTGKTLGTSTDSVKPTLSGGAVSAALIAKNGSTEFTFVPMRI